MAVNFGVNLANGEIIGTSNTTLYTAPSSIIRAVINQARLVNYSAGPVVVSVFILQSGEAASNEFKALDGKSLAANETYLVSEIIGDSVDAGGTIVAIADTATAVSFSATGTEFTA